MKKRILIAVPSAGLIENETFVSIYNMNIPDNIETELKVFYGYLIDDVRNSIVTYAKKEKFDGVLFVDADMKLPKDILIKMLNEDKEIVVGLYAKKEDGNEIEAFVRNTDPSIRSALKRISYQDIVGKRSLEIDAAGFGCVLIKIEVFYRLPSPYFKYTINGEFRYGEDIDFCMKARSAGFKIFAITDTNIGHIGKREYKIL